MSPTSSAFFTEMSWLLFFFFIVLTVKRTSVYCRRDKSGQQTQVGKLWHGLPGEAVGFPASEAEIRLENRLLCGFM